MDPITVGPAQTKYIRLSVDIWCQPSDRTIHMAASKSGPRFHTAISGDPVSKSHHASLFSQLRKLLEENGRWPPEEAG